MGLAPLDPPYEDHSHSVCLLLSLQGAADCEEHDRRKQGPDADRPPSTGEVGRRAAHSPRKDTGKVSDHDRQRYEQRPADDPAPPAQPRRAGAVEVETADPRSAHQRDEQRIAQGFGGEQTEIAPSHISPAQYAKFSTEPAVNSRAQAALPAIAWRPRADGRGLECTA